MPISKTDLIELLCIERTKRVLLREGVSPDTANRRATDLIKQQNLNETTAMATPEGGLVSIVETYVNSALDALTKLKASGHEVGSEEFKEQFSVAEAFIIGSIENHRNSFVHGSRDYPRTFEDYVVYRVQLEVRNISGVDPFRVGFDDETTRLMANTAKAEFLKVIKYAQTTESSKCFVASVCFSPDHPVVATLREFRDRVLLTNRAGSTFVRWYYLNGPGIAQLFGRHKILVWFTRPILLISTTLIRKLFQVN